MHSTLSTTSFSIELVRRKASECRSVSNVARKVRGTGSSPGATNHFRAERTTWHTAGRDSDLRYIRRPGSRETVRLTLIGGVSGFRDTPGHPHNTRPRPEQLHVLQFTRQPETCPNTVSRMGPEGTHGTAKSPCFNRPWKQKAGE